MALTKKSKSKKKKMVPASFSKQRAGRWHQHAGAARRQPQGKRWRLRALARQRECTKVAPTSFRPHSIPEAPSSQASA